MSLQQLHLTRRVLSAPWAAGLVTHEARGGGFPDLVDFHEVPLLVYEMLHQTLCSGMALLFLWVWEDSLLSVMLGSLEASTAHLLPLVGPESWTQPTP